jgi:curved DNA-binding protein CbpA
MRPPEIPADDLYARLELPGDAAPEAVEIAWRALLKRHHPDVAGADSLEAAKRINVAHDWLSDPGLRDRYDRARRGRASARGRAPDGTPRPGSPSSRSASFAWPFGGGLDRDDGRPADLGIDSAPVQAFLDRVAALTVDDIDRLALADAPPIAFVASIRRFLSPDRLEAVDAIEAAIDARLPVSARSEPRAREAVASFGHALVLGGFLADELSEPFRERVEERMTRGWEAAVGLRRYGPNTSEVAGLVARLRGLSAAEVDRIAADVRRLRLEDVSWPPGASASEEEGLRISVALARRDAAAAIPGGEAREAPMAAGRALAALAGIVALRRAYSPAEFARLIGPFAELGLVAGAAAARR